MTLWIGLIFGLYLISVIIFFFVYSAKEKKLLQGTKEQLSNFENEKKIKKHLVSELALSSQKLVAAGEFKEMTTERDNLLNEVAIQREQISGANSQITLLEGRLEELIKVKGELEVGSEEVLKEIETLRAQEEEMQTKGREIREQIRLVKEKINSLKESLSELPKAKQCLESVELGLKSTDERSEFFEQEILNINKNYLTLKKAYDALDIEYARLYEKQE